MFFHGPIFKESGGFCKLLHTTFQGDGPTEDTGGQFIIYDDFLFFLIPQILLVDPAIPGFLKANLSFLIFKAGNEKFSSSHFLLVSEIATFVTRKRIPLHQELLWYLMDNCLKEISFTQNKQR